MGTIHVKELNGGLDVRKLPETTPGGVLVKADDGHITRGGEFEGRAAFVPEFTLPAGTVGLAHTRTGLVVFGSGAAPAGLSPFLQYQQLAKGGRTLVRILDWELFEGKIYAVALFDDGTVAQFYDGVEDTSWQEARASVALQIVSGSIQEAEAATAQFEVTAGIGEIIDRLLSLDVDGTQLLLGPITHTGDNSTTAAAIADAINANPTTPEYNAVAVGPVVELTAGRAGTAANGRVIGWTVQGSMELDNETVFSGGSEEIVPEITRLRIDGVDVLRGPVEWTGSPESMAAAVADSISDLASNPEYEAIADGDLVIIKTTTAGTAQNGRTLVADTDGTITLAYPGGTATAGGADLSGDSFLPAEVILTMKTRLFAGAGSLLHYSAIQNATFWAPGGTDPNEIGAGFSNIAAANSSSYKITGLARYFDKLAVFTPDTVQTWVTDPDPDLIAQGQVLENTGTECPRSISQFGDSDIFYLDASGVRSLRARDSSNAAATTDIGVPIDDILTARVARMTAEDKSNVIGIINPQDKRFWLIMGNEVFVYSYFPNSKVNAWTRYNAATTVGEVTTTLNVTEAIVFDRRVFLRSGNTVYCYGGWGKIPEYDDTRAVARLPLLDANAPAAEKDWRGIDAALSGEWEASVSFSNDQVENRIPVAILAGTTFGQRRIPCKHRSTHMDLEMTSRGGPAKLSAFVFHFDGKVNED